VAAWGSFLEQVEYNGRRLAKLNVPPSVIQESLAGYEQLAGPALKTALLLQPGARWAWEQLHLLILLALNRAYYQVREREAAAFYHLFRAQVTSASLDQLLQQSLRTLAEFTGAEEAHCYLLDPEGNQWTLRATAGKEGQLKKPRRATPRAIPCSSRMMERFRRPHSSRIGGSRWGLFLDPSWNGKYAWGWSVPLLADGCALGLFQFAFPRRYDWLPREQELLGAAAERCSAAIQRAQLLEDLAQREKQIRALAEHMLHVEEVERRRISRELHDEAGQSLLYLRLQLEILERAVLAGEIEGLRDRLKTLRQICEQTILEMRRLIAALSPAVLEQLGLAAALRQLARRLQQVHPCQVELELDSLQGLPKPVETVVYRLVQECCNNIARHSQARQVKISVQQADGILRVEVEDDGVGFSVEEALSRAGSYGLTGMRERVALLGGVLQIESPRASSGRRRGSSRPGSRIVAELPVVTGTSQATKAANQGWIDQEGTDDQNTRSASG